MKLSSRSKRVSVIVAAAIAFAWSAPAEAGLVAYYPLDTGSGTVADEIVGGVGASAFDGTILSGGTWAADRNGNAGRAIALNGGTSAYITTTALASQLGIGGATPKTVSVWAKVNAWGDDGLFDIGEYATAKEFSLRNVGGTVNRFRAQFIASDYDFNVNGTDQGVGGTQVKAANGNWVHYVVRYDGVQSQTFADGIMVGSRVHALNTTDVQPFTIGRYGANNSNTLGGEIDDVAVWNVALPYESIKGLRDGAYTPLTAPTVEAPIAAPYGGDSGLFAVREVANNGQLLSIAHADVSLRTGAGSITDTYSAFVDRIDPDNSGGTGRFASTERLSSNTPGDNNDIALLARGMIRITQEGDYTFGYNGDDGSRLRIVGQNFVSAVGNGGTSISGDTMITPGTGGGLNALGVMHLKPGDYQLEYTWFERSGGANTELYAARGAKTAFDGDFRLINERQTPYPVTLTKDFDVVVIRDGGVSNIATAIAKVEAWWNSGTGTNVTVANGEPFINYYDPGSYGSGGNFGLGTVFPGDPAGDQNNFCLGATGQFQIDVAGMYTFGVNSDDGVRFRILGTSGWTVWNTSLAPSGDGFQFDGSGANRGGYLFLTPGLYDFDLVFAENAGGAYLDLWTAYGAMSGYDNRFYLLGGEPTDSAVLLAIPEPVSVALLGLGITGLGGYIRRRRAA